ncbi:MAG: N-acetylmuramoyl-L-alanine amidase [Defluviitaleaceae bacterium]|nr:N-acetylmuramoyl-L-alanine amidase [Defluviitaleaceae bacterium]
MKIFIDAGHNYSGFNTGAVGNGMREQDVTFSVAGHLARFLVEAGVEVRLSRPTLQTNLGVDNASAINARWQMANEWGADYFVSVHVNAGGGTGAETLFGQESDRKFAQTVQDVFSERTGLKNRRIWLREDLGVLRHTKMSAVLIEVAFIDAPAGSLDLEVLRNGHMEMGRAIADGVLKYLGINPKPEVKPQPQPDVVRFNSVAQMPDWAKPTIQKLVDKGFLSGTGQGLDLSMDMVRVFVIHDRARMYG